MSTRCRKDVTSHTDFVASKWNFAAISRKKSIIDLWVHLTGDMFRQNVNLTLDLPTPQFFPGSSQQMFRFEGYGSCIIFLSLSCKCTQRPMTFRLKGILGNMVSLWTLLTARICRTYEEPDLISVNFSDNIRTRNSNFFALKIDFRDLWISQQQLASKSLRTQKLSNQFSETKAIQKMMYKI